MLNIHIQHHLVNSDQQQTLIKMRDHAIGLQDMGVYIKFRYLILNFFCFVFLHLGGCRLEAFPVPSQPPVSKITLIFPNLLVVLLLYLQKILYNSFVGRKIY